MDAALKEFQSTENQGHDDYQDTRQVTQMLHLQAELKHKLEDYQHDHQGKQEPAVVADIWQAQTAPGLGLGLW